MRIARAVLTLAITYASTAPAQSSPALAPPPAPLDSGLAIADSLRSDAEIREVVMRHAVSVQRCYEQEGLARNATLRGTLELELTILPVGRVSEAVVRKSAMRGAGAKEVADCIAAAARNWRFTRGPFVTDVILLPFTLIPKTAALRSPGGHS